MDYTKTLPELLELFPINLQTQRVESIGWFTLGERSKNIPLIKKGIIKQCEVVLLMLDFAGINETLLTTVGVIMSSHFIFGNYDFEQGIISLLQKIDNLFIHELSLPAHQTGYGSQTELVKDLRMNMNQVVKLLSLI